MILYAYVCVCFSMTQVRTIIDNYKSTNRNIGANCRKISEMLLVKLDGKRVYDGNEFEVEQYNHRQTTHKKIKNIHVSIVTTMRKIFEVWRLHKLHSGLRYEAFWG